MRIGKPRMDTDRHGWKRGRRPLAVGFARWAGRVRRQPRAAAGIHAWMGKCLMADLRGSRVRSVWSAVTCHRFCAGDLSPSDFPVGSAPPRVPGLARAVNAPLQIRSFRCSTATSRLTKAVTSHRTPKAARSVANPAARVSSVSIRVYPWLKFRLLSQSE